MEPRKSVVGPQQSTNIPADYLRQVQELLVENLGDRLKGKTLFVEGRIFPAEIILSIGFREESSALRQVNFEASMDHENKDLTRLIGICVDAATSMLEQYLDADGDLELPRFWTAFPMGDQKVFLQTTGRNTELEAEANRLLGLDTNESLYTADGEDRDVTEELEQLLKEADEKAGGKVH